MSDQTSLRPDRATIPADDWAQIQRRAGYDNRIAALIWTYQDGWRAGLQHAHEQIVAAGTPQPPQEESAK